MKYVRTRWGNRLTVGGVVIQSTADTVLEDAALPAVQDAAARASIVLLVSDTPTPAAPDDDDLDPDLFPVQLGDGQIRRGSRIAEAVGALKTP